MDTQRTLAQVLALLADNTTGQISPQDARDAIVSVFANFGMINTTAIQNQTLSASPAKITQFTELLSSGCVTASHISDRLTATVDGKYLIIFGLSINADEYTDCSFAAYVNGGGPSSNRKSSKVMIIDASEYKESVGFSICDLIAGQYVELFGSSVPTASITFAHLGMLMIKIG